MQVFGVFRNTDLTEGKGHQLAVGYFTTEGPAQEAAQGIDVQGCNGIVKPIEVHDSFDSWFESLEGWEKDIHLTRLRKARARLDALIGG